LLIWSGPGDDGALGWPIGASYLRQDGTLAFIAHWLGQSPGSCVLVTGCCRNWRSRGQGPLGGRLVSDAGLAGAAAGAAGALCWLGDWAAHEDGDSYGACVEWNRQPGALLLMALVISLSGLADLRAG